MKSKYIGIGIIALLIGVVALSGCTQSPQNTTQQNAPNTVTIQNFAFNPNSLTVKAGTTVTWINQDSATHRVTSDTGAFQSQNLNTGDKFTFKFSKAGEYPYHCSIHPSMTAKIIVQ